MRPSPRIGKNKPRQKAKFQQTISFSWHYPLPILDTGTLQTNQSLSWLVDNPIDTKRIKDYTWLNYLFKVDLA